MSHRTTIDKSDEGKRVINADGEELGVVADVTAGTAHVNPDAGITDKIKAKLGWEDPDEETYRLPSESVENITDDEVRIGRNF